MNKPRIIRILIIFVGMMSIGLGIGFYFAGYYQSQTRPAIQGLLWPDPKQLQTFAAIDQSGQMFGIDRLQGRWSMLFFGYTHCPDVCPLTLAVLNDLNKQLQGSAAARDLQVIFVTLDPERDTTKRLQEYVGYFNPAFIGLGGTIDQIMSLAGQVGAFYMYGDKSATGDYVVDHTAAVFLIDPRGRLVAIFSSPHQVDSIRERYKMIREFVERQTNT